MGIAMDITEEAPVMLRYGVRSISISRSSSNIYIMLLVQIKLIGLIYKINMIN